MGKVTWIEENLIIKEFYIEVKFYLFELDEVNQNLHLIFRAIQA